MQSVPSASLSSSSSSSKSNSTPISIVALPSMVHSLSTLPNITAIPSDLLYYGGYGLARNISEEKLRNALDKTRKGDTERQPIVSNFDYYRAAGPSDVITVRRKKQKINN